MIKLIKDATSAEILARHAPIEFPKYADWFMISIEKRDELLKYLFGTSSLVDLGLKSGILESKKRKRRKMRKRNKKKKGD